MRAVYNERSGQATRLVVGEVPIPCPKSNELLVEIHATSVNALDLKLNRGLRILPSKKIILGRDAAGIVVESGLQFSPFQPGDRVYFCTHAMVGATYAEYATAPIDGIAFMPNNLTYEQAAGVPSTALTAWQGLHMGRAGPGKRVLVVGSGGGVTTFAVQIARVLGAEVWVLANRQHHQLLALLGAKQVLDYAPVNHVRYRNHFDLIFDTAPGHSYKPYVSLLKKHGLYLSTEPNLQPAREQQPGHLPYIHVEGEKRAVKVSIRASGWDLARISQLIEAHEIQPIIDRVYPLQQAQAAHEYLDQHRVMGKVILAIR